MEHVETTGSSWPILADFARVGLDPGVRHAATCRQVAVNLVTMVLSWTACFGNMIVE